MAHTSFTVGGFDVVIHRFDSAKVPRKVTALVYNGRRLSFVDKKGDMYSSAINETNCYHYGSNFHPRFLGVLEDAAALGLIPEKVKLGELARKIKEQVALKNNRYTATRIFENAKTLGMKLTPEQKRNLMQHIKASKEEI